MNKKKQFDQPEKPTILTPEIQQNPKEIPFIEPKGPEIIPQHNPKPQPSHEPNTPLRPLGF